MREELKSAEARSGNEKALPLREAYGASCKYLVKIVRFKKKISRQFLA
jgi:hypothetical protein